MTPIAKKGETVEQAIGRVSKLVPPKRPSAIDLGGGKLSNTADGAGHKQAAEAYRMNELSGSQLKLAPDDQKGENISPTVRKTSTGHDRVAELLATSRTKPQLKLAAAKADPGRNSEDISPTDTTVVQRGQTPQISQQPSILSTTTHGDCFDQAKASNDTAGHQRSTEGSK